MKTSPVSIHPYFKIHPDKLEPLKALLPRFVEKTAPESKVLYYEFTLNGDELHCREAYQDADGLLTHLQSVSQLLEEAGKLADITRVEIHGPASELAKLKEPLAHLNAAWFETVCGIDR